MQSALGHPFQISRIEEQKDRRNVYLVEAWSDLEASSPATAVCHTLKQISQFAPVVQFPWALNTTPTDDTDELAYFYWDVPSATELSMFTSSGICLKHCIPEDSFVATETVALMWERKQQTRPVVSDKTSTMARGRYHLTVPGEVLELDDCRENEAIIEFLKIATGSYFSTHFTSNGSLKKLQATDKMGLPKLPQTTLQSH